jgi:glutamate synthase (NADPH/NADH) large chain
MTGGVLYQCLYPEFGFEREAVERRLSKSAKVKISAVSQKGLRDIRQLLERYILELEQGFQRREAQALTKILLDAAERFLMIKPRALRPPSAE